MIFTLKGCEKINDEQVGAIYDLTGQGPSPPGFNVFDPIEVVLREGRMTAVQGDLVARFEEGEWMTWASCDKCGLDWLSTEEDVDCPTCEAIRTKDRGKW